MGQEIPARVFIIEIAESGFVQAYDGRTAEDLIKSELEMARGAIDKLLGKKDD